MISLNYFCQSASFSSLFSQISEASHFTRPDEIIFFCLDNGNIIFRDLLGNLLDTFSQSRPCQYTVLLATSSKKKHFHRRILQQFGPEWAFGLVLKVLYHFMYHHSYIPTWLPMLLDLEKPKQANRRTIFEPYHDSIKVYNASGMQSGDQIQ